MAVRVAINGFGRIGRSVLRALATRPGDIEIVALNDIATPEICAYLFEYDSVFGPYPGSVALRAGHLVVDGREIPLLRQSDLSHADLSGVDVLMECTGRADSREVAERGLSAGARRVLVSGPSRGADITAVIGANEGEVTPLHRIISNASCTTNALAPLLGLLDAEWGVETGYMTTIHCYTGSQPTVDSPAADFARSRAAALSMVPTTTSASRLVDIVLPHLAGRVEGSAVRVPTASVSAVDLTFMPRRPASVQAVNAALREAGGVIGWTERALVSTDLRARPESVVMALPETAVTGGGMVRVFGWYDNEWGFSNRMIDMAVRLARQDQEQAGGRQPQVETTV